MVGPLLFFVLQAALVASNDYVGHQVLRLIPEKQHHLDFLHDIMTKDTGMNLDFWTEPRGEGHPVDIQVPPEFLRYLKQVFDDTDLKYHTMIDDLQSLINEQSKRSQEAKATRGADIKITEDYLAFDEMMAWVEDMGQQCGSRCEVIDIGDTYEGRVLKVIKVTDGSGATDKQVAWVDGGIHAREWIAPSVVLYFIDQMINGLDTNPQVQAMVASHDWYFLPLVNPDGYEYSRLTDRMWRKTRVPNEGSTCVGADANRNFDHNFAGPGTSSNPCSETFHGMSAYSQPCAGVVASFVEENTQDPYRHIFMTLHSYSQLWMAPWGYTYDRPANYDELMRVGNAAAAALQAVHGTVFEVGSASEILYLSSGTSRDWAYGVPGFEFVYTLELRDTGNYGFLLPPEQILPSGEETWAALTAMYDAIMNP